MTGIKVPLLRIYGKRTCKEATSTLVSIERETTFAPFWGELFAVFDWPGETVGNLTLFGCYRWAGSFDQQKLPFC